MAGTSLGAPAPTSPAPTALDRAPGRLATATRTRRLHAVFPLGDDLASVHSSRRSIETRGVIVTLSDGAQWQSVRMLPAQARAMARTLLDAAEAVELSQRHAKTDPTTLQASAALAHEGGAA